MGDPNKSLDLRMIVLEMKMNESRDITMISLEFPLTHSPDSHCASH